MRFNSTLPLKFAIWGAALFFLAASGFTYLDYQRAVRQMDAVAATGNTFVSRALWNQIKADLDHSHEDNLGSKPKQPGYELNAEHVNVLARQITQDTNVTKVKIYDIKGRVLYSTDPIQTGTLEPNNPRFRKALTGQTVNHAQFFPYILGFDGTLHNRYMNATYISLKINRTKTSGQPAVFEIYSDLTDLKKAATDTAITQFIVTTAMLLIVYISLLLIVIRGNRTLRRIHEARVRASERAAHLAEASEAKSVFLAHMSHELRTPLNAIIGFSDIIKNSANRPLSQETLTEYGGDINNSAKHLLEIISNLLDLTGMESGRTEADIGKINLRQVIEESLRMVDQLAAAGGVTLAMDLYPELPVIESDKQRIKQILINLLSNAIKFTPEGGKITVSAETEETGKRVVLRVTDTGIGMSSDTAKNELNIRRYGDVMVAKKSAGAGLGLTITRRFAELLCGQFLIDSTIGKGTTATLILPISFPGSDIPIKMDNSERTSGKAA